MKLFVVVGLGQFGFHTAKEIYAGGGDVLAIDADEKRVADAKDLVGQAVCMNGADLNALRAVGANKADTAVVALGEEDLEGSILACTALSDLGVGRIIARAASAMQGRILSRVGATRVVYPEKQMGEEIARSILVSGVLEQVTLSTGQTVAHILPKEEFTGIPLKEARFRSHFGVAVIGIQRKKQSVDDRGEIKIEMELQQVPGPDEIISSDDVLVVVGDRFQIKQIARKD